MSNEENTVITTQLTSKRLKFNKLVSYTFITIGLMLVLFGADNKHSVAWGSLFTLYGFGHLTVTRIRIWWNHK
jgi:hypothetical protein